MLRTQFEKSWKAIASILRRIKGVGLLGASVQFEPSQDTSFTRAQDERELRHEIYLVAGIEAYAAMDGGRRLRELMLPELQAVQHYLAENPEMARFVERHIQAGTCAVGVAELREWKQKYRQARLAERGELPKREHDPEFDWMRQFAAGSTMSSRAQIPK
jgi:hypothetical protein